MLGTYLMAAFGMSFAALSAFALFTAIRHLDPPDVDTPVAPPVAAPHVPEKIAV